MRNAGMEEAQAGIKIARRNINNLRYADDHPYGRCLGSGGGFGQEGLDHGWQPGSDQGSGPFF